jgi:P4 family phage/plasmid primase-like protien
MPNGNPKRRKSARPKHRSRDEKSEKPRQPEESLTDPHRLAEIFLRENGLERPHERLIHWRNEFWSWAGQRYEPIPPADLRARLIPSIRRAFTRDRARVAKFKGRITRGLIGDVLQALESLLHLASSTEQPVWLGQLVQRPFAGFIAVENGLLDLHLLLSGNRNALRPHSSQWFSPICLNYRHDPDATCPLWLAFLDDALEADAERITLVQEWFGYCLAYDTSLQKFLVLVGEGADGKTVLVLMLIALVGPENVSHVPLELFGQRFQLTATLGKLVNAVTEIGELDKAAEGLLKAFVSGDPMFFDRKNLPGVNTRPTARCLFTTNTLPSFRDRSSGLWRRMVVLPFRQSVPLDKQDVHLVDKLTAELPGIFNWAIEGLRRLRCRGRFTDPALCREALETYRTESNPARAFLQECVVAKPDGVVECDDLRQRQRMWCEEHGYRPLNAAQFGHEVRRVFPTVVRKKVPSLDGGTRVWAYLGIDLV